MLQSKLLSGDPKLEACAVYDSAHVTPGAVGDHVAKIQAALRMLDGLVIDQSELAGKSYGPSTAAAVLSFKRKRNIINWSYQSQADNIVGKMTIAALDREILLKESQPSSEEDDCYFGPAQVDGRGTAAQVQSLASEAVGAGPQQVLPSDIAKLWAVEVALWVVNVKHHLGRSDMSAEQGPRNPQFELRGINHLALVSSDMARTIDFYSNVLGMPLVMSLEMPGGGNHFFFDIGKGDLLAFFHFPNAPKAAPGIASPRKLVGDSADPKDGITAHASMNHVAFDVPAEKFDEYCQRLKAKGIRTTIFNHDESRRTYSDTVNETTWIRSVYFMDPDGIELEFAAWIRPLKDVKFACAAVRNTDRAQPSAAASTAATTS